MGWVSCGEASLAIDDRALRHLQLGVSAALAVGESFFLSWREDGIGRTSVWVDRASSLKYRYSASPPRDINPRWVIAYRMAASAPTGITVIDEAEIPTGVPSAQRPVVALRDNAGHWGPLASPK